MYNKLTMFAFYSWSAEAEDAKKNIPRDLLLEYSAAYFFSLDCHKPWMPITAGAVASIFVLCIRSASCLFSFRAHHPYLLIP